jgi:hypothetical protein
VGVPTYLTQIEDFPDVGLLTWRLLHNVLA